MFFIQGEALHKLNQVHQENPYLIEIGDDKFQFSKIQIALLSPTVFKYFLHKKDQFRIEAS
jgi:hypothetical protein